MRADRPNEMMKLGAFFHPTGNHVAAWLHPEPQIDAGTNFKHYARLAQTAERGRFDLMFLADALAVRDGKLAALSRWPQYMAYLDPVTLLSAIAALTEHIGLVATATTSYNEPYNIARKFASLDHISGGRAGWNVVTSSNLSEAYNFGREAHFEHAERYDRAIEFADIVRGLWDSWDDDAFIRDRASGRYFDPAKLHVLNHKGKHFSVKGPLNVARPPQGHPVIFQAGSSEVGHELAARTAEGVFTPQHSMVGAQEFYRDVKGRMSKYGRPPEALKIMPGLNAIVGRTTAIRATCRERTRCSTGRARAAPCGATAASARARARAPDRTPSPRPRSRSPATRPARGRTTPHKRGNPSAWRRSSERRVTWSTSRQGAATLDRRCI